MGLYWNLLDSIFSGSHTKLELQEKQRDLWEDEQNESGSVLNQSKRTTNLFNSLMIIKLKLRPQYRNVQKQPQ